MTMKQYVVNQYKSIFDELLLPLGFKRHTIGYYRVVNDVAHLILLFYSGLTSTVEFSIEPLATPIPTLGLDRRGIMDVPYLKKRSMWTIWGLADSGETARQNATNGLSRLCNMTYDYVFPLFEKADSCQTALPVLRQLEHEKNAYIVTQEFWMCLKNHDFEQSITALNRYGRFDPNSVEKQAVRMFRNPDNRETFLKKHYTIGLARNAKMDIITEHLKQHDTAFVDEIISFNEKRCLDYYAHPSKGFHRYQPDPWDF